MSTLFSPAVLAGVARHARIEARVQLFTWTALGWFLWPAVGLVTLFFLRDTSVMRSAISLAQLGIPGVVAMYVVTGGLLGIGGALVEEREDGTLLRAKTIPGGISAHLAGNMITYGFVALVPVAAFLLVGSVAVETALPATPSRWLLLVAVCLLGLIATMPAGAVLGCLVRGPLAMAVIGTVTMASTAISGIFYPLTALPVWLQWVGQALPTYWIGMGLRAALLPPEAASLELHGSWQLATMTAVLGFWCAAGVLLAPGALRRMARRQSGSVVAAARERVMAKGY